MSRPPKLRTCALCGAPETAAHAPFCSHGCRDRDLLNWLGDAYAIPGPPADPDEVFASMAPGLDSDAERPV